MGGVVAGSLLVMVKSGYMRKNIQPHVNHHYYL